MPREAPGVTPPWLSTDHTAVLVNDGLGLAEAVADVLSRRNIQSHVVSEADQVPEDARVIVHLGAARPFDGIEDAIPLNRDAFMTATRIAGKFSEDGGLFVLVQDTGGKFGFDRWCDAVQASLGGLAGLAKTAAREWPLATVRAIDLDVGHRELHEVAEQLVDELFRGGESVEVGLPEDGRFGLRLVEEEVSGGRPVVDETSIIVASGGARGVTAECLLELAKQTAASFVLLGRTPLDEEPAVVRGIEDDAQMKRLLLEEAKSRGEMPTPASLGATVAGIRKGREIREVLQRFDALGSRARYIPADVRDIAALGNALDEIRREWGPITGIVHGAGVLADRLLIDKTPEQFERVFGTKVSGYYALTAATSQDPLRLICLFSSVAGRSGNSGQADYAMANEVLNKLAQSERRRRGKECHVKSINWGPWESGMVTPQLRREFEKRGVTLIPVEDGARAFVDEVQGASPDEVEVVVGTVELGAAALDDSVEESGEAGEFEFEHEVSVRTHPFLMDHAVQGTPVLPVVGVLEWFTRAAMELYPGMDVAGLRDVQVLRAAKLDDFLEQGDRFLVRAEKRTNGVATARLTLFDESGDALYRATAVMASEAREEQCSIVLSGDAWSGLVYGGEALFHGPQFQVLQSVELDETGAAALVSGARQMGWGTASTQSFDVPAFDGALQLAVLWTNRQLSGASLPMKLSGVHFYQTPREDQDRFLCRIRSRALDRTRAVSEVELTTESGELVARIEGLETFVYRPFER